MWILLLWWLWLLRFSMFWILTEPLMDIYSELITNNKFILFQGSNNETMQQINYLKYFLIYLTTARKKGERPTILLTYGIYTKEKNYESRFHNIKKALNILALDYYQLLLINSVTNTITYFIQTIHQTKRERAIQPTQMR